MITLARIYFLLMAAIILLAMPTHARNPVPAMEPAGEHGVVDWVGLAVRAEGIGAAPGNALTPAQARAGARRAAIVDARRNLLEALGAVRISATSTIQDAMTESDVIRTEIHGLLRGASVERLDLMADGTYRAVLSYPLSGPLAHTLARTMPPRPATSTTTTRTQAQPAAPARQTVTSAAYAEQSRLLAERTRELEMLRAANSTHGDTVVKLQGEIQNLREALERMQAEQADPAHKVQARKVRPDEPYVLEAPLDDDAAARQAGAAADTGPAYTGLIVDARGLDFAPSLRPMLLDPGHPDAPLYPGPGTDTAVGQSSGYARYFTDLNEARQSDRAGTLALTVTATDATQEGLVLDAKDAATLRSLLTMPDNPVDACRVVVVF